jgi:hypothetical protein
MIGVRVRVSNGSLSPHWITIIDFRAEGPNKLKTDREAPINTALGSLGTRHAPIAMFLLPTH